MRSTSDSSPAARDIHKGKPGRPTSYSTAIAARICELLAEGRPVRQVAREPGMPAASTIFQWLACRPDFCERYQRAKDTAVDSYIDELIDIADDPDLVPADKRARIHARKWLASTIKPRKYGDKIDVGAPGELTSVSDETLSARLATAMARADAPVPSPASGPRGDDEPA